VQRLTAPVATNVRVHAEGVTLRQMQPDAPQDVFVGQDLVVFARYRGAGAATLTFAGDSPEGPVQWTERVTFPDRGRDNAFVAKLWAVQRVGWLSAERRRAGANPELDNELRELGTRYGIPTELSSYLVLEPGMQMPAGGGRSGRVGDPGVLSAGTGSPAPRIDFAATRASAEQRAAKSLADANAPAIISGSVAGDGTRRETLSPRQVGERTFVQQEGRWMDTRYREGVRRVLIKPFSPAYFSLVQRVPELQAVFALGEQVTAAGRNVTLVLDANGVDQLSGSDLAGIVRDW
jgi:Ca-activated chloride channel family protein